MPASTPWWSTPSIAAPRPGRSPTLVLAAAIVALIPLTCRATMADPLARSAATPPAQVLTGTVTSERQQPAGGGARRRYSVYAASFGIEHGTCERSLMRRIPPGAGTALPAGSAVSRSMDRFDHYCVSQALEYAPDRAAIRWYGGTGGYAYAVIPLTTYRIEADYCRDFQAIAWLEDSDARTVATACRMADGSWHSRD